MSNPPDGTGVRTLSYDDKGRLSAETNALAVITRRYDAQGRDAGYDLEIPGYAANVFSVRYGYDGAGLFSCVTSLYASAAHVFRYTRLPGTAAVAGYTASDLAESFTFRSKRSGVVCLGSWMRVCSPVRLSDILASCWDS